MPGAGRRLCVWARHVCMNKRSRLRSLRVSEGFKSYVIDQLEGLDRLVARSMFGGVGLYCDGLFFGIIASDVLYLKADEVNRPAYARAGAAPFRPYADRAGTMQYYSVPVGVLDSQPEVLEWARGALAAAARAARAPSGGGRSPRRRSAGSRVVRRTKTEKGPS